MKKFLHLYNSAVTFEADYNGEAYHEPWVSLTRENKEVNYNKPDPSNGHCYVDLGLPSGTLWACTNLGAENPEDLGTRYKWAEIEPYDGERQYKYIDPNTYGFSKYCETDGKTILDLEDDAANVEWGGGWHIPSLEQVYELMDNTTRDTSHITGEGYGGGYVIFISNINGNQITFPLSNGLVCWMNECGSYGQEAWTFCYGCEGSLGPRLGGDTGYRQSGHRVRGVLGDGPEREDLDV